MPAPAVTPRRRVTVTRTARAAGEDATAENGVHVPTAPRTGEAVQNEQVLVQAQEIRGGHQPDADRNTGETRSIERLQDVTSGVWSRCLGPYLVKLAQVPQKETQKGGCYLLASQGCPFCTGLV
ncbi:hypothetical protein EVAR_7382_1 [Eumeta japonica]|uniref:Uncharacterized protein n=1 Tax=Eumeta variegata TaxID=151549 RepID=A0A4C1V697_EUMVA|nr:hypothetical protein EVAR_7382_1 [Eumeta japonica]